MKEVKIRDNQYITIMGWMRNIPEIETNTELMAYGLIYGFSQTEEQYLTCRQSYIAHWLRISRPRCNELLIRMESKGLIRKILANSKGIIRIYKYCCILPSDMSSQTEHVEFSNRTPTSSKGEHVASSQTEHKYNNINNNILNISYPRANQPSNNTNNKINQYKQFNQFMHQDYDFEQLEMELPCNMSKKL